MYAATFDRHVIRRPRPSRLAAERARRFAVLVAVGVGVVVLLAIALAQTVHGGGTGGYDDVVVAPGDTVWSIAAARYPGDDTRERVSEIMSANGLGGPVLQPGQHLRVPNRD